MFTINLGDGREAPSKARKKGAKRLEFLVIYIFIYMIVGINKSNLGIFFILISNLV